MTMGSWLTQPPKGGVTVRGWRLLVAALIGIIALVLTAAVTVAPKAAADDSEGTTTSTQNVDTTDLDNVRGLDDGQYPAATAEQTTGDQTENPSDSSETQSPAAEETTSPESSETETNESNAPPADEPESRQQSRALKAADNKIEANVTKITGVPDNGQQLNVGDKARVEGTWEAVDQNAGGVAAGDKFTVGFPSQLKLPAGATFNLIGSDGSDRQRR
ncbi:hypothetical protein ACYB2S_13270 [Corynebacterium variabile]|uniref:hypothetical protein n=1 Tax=Corynebacterium variabile TaxID=1727 RepID=UPI003C8E511E